MSLAPAAAPPDDPARPGPTGPGAPSAEVLRRRWELVLPHREQLLRTARRRVDTREDAEDVVTTAMIRTVEHPGLDEGRVGAFLCTTVLRLTADVHRTRARELATGVRTAVRALPCTPHDEQVCDEAEARWLSAQLRGCPERERQVLAARLAGLTAGETTARLGLSANAAENAYTRLRRRAQGLVAATLGATALLARFGRRVGKPALATVPVAMTALAVLVAPGEGRAGPPRVTAEAALAPRAVAVAVGTLPGKNAPARPGTRGNGGAVRTPTTTRAAAAPRPAPARTEVRAPAVVEGLDAGGVAVDRRHEEESFEESVRRCVRDLDVGDLTDDPCD